MESSCPSVMLVCAAGSKRNGGMESREFPLKVHTSQGGAASKVQKAYLRERGSERRLLRQE